MAGNGDEGLTAAERLLGASAASKDEFVAFLSDPPDAQARGMLGLGEPDGGAGGEPEPAPAPEPAPEPTEPAPEPADGDPTDGEAAAGDGDGEPVWFKDLPEPARAEARKLHQTVEGQRHALARRTAAQKAAEDERRDAITIAVQLRRQMLEKGLDPLSAEGARSAPATEPQPGDFLELEIDDAGNARIPMARVNEAIDRRAREIALQNGQAHGRAAQTGQYANRLLSEAGVVEATQERFVSAIQFTQEALGRIVREGGRMPANAAEERQMLAEAGVDAEVAKRFGGVRVVDVYDVYEAVRNPFEHGHRLVDITKRYQDSWGQAPGAGPAKKVAPAASRVPSHPGSLARKGAQEVAGSAPGGTAEDEFMGMSMDDILAGARDPKKIKDLFSKWDKEVSARG